MKKLNRISLFMEVALTATLMHSSAFAGDQIIHAYQSVRSSGMGGVFLTTGLYDENFFGNPARVTANPSWRVTLLDPMVETNSNLPNTLSSLTSGSAKLTDLAKYTGTNNHGRVQTTLPSAYFSFGENREWGIAFGIITSTQFDVDLHRNYDIDPQVITDVGPAFTIGRKFLENRELSVGLTTHVTYRVASNTGLSFLDLVQGKKIDAKTLAGQGAGLDFDLGSTYLLPWQPIEKMELTVAASINNLLGGKFTNLGLQPIPDFTGAPRAQPRTLGLGVAARYPELSVFKDNVVALEFSDIGNNPKGSFFRWMHIGAETRLVNVFLPRLGFNQGYLAAGLGIDLKFVTLDFATYGEELTLNAGGMQDRRYAFKLAFQI